MGHGGPHLTPHEWEFCVFSLLHATCPMLLILKEPFVIDDRYQYDKPQQKRKAGTIYPIFNLARDFSVEQSGKQRDKYFAAIKRWNRQDVHYRERQRNNRDDHQHQL